MFADSVGKFLDRNAPPERVAKWREDGHGRARILARGGAGGAARGQRARGLWRAGRRFPPRRGGRRADHPQGRRGLRRRPAQRHHHPLHPGARHRGAEAALAAEAGLGRAGRGDRDERAGRRLGPAVGPHHRAQGRQRLPDQRRQDLHLQRPDRRPDRRRRQDRPEGGRQGRLAARRRARRGRGLPPRQEARQGRARCAGHVRIVLRRRLGAGRQSARARGGQGLLPADGRAAARAAADRARQRGRRWSGRSRRRSPT